MKIILLALLFPIAAWAADPSDFLMEGGRTRRVAQSGGDTIGTYSVLCNSTGVANLLRAAVTDKSRRRICFENRGGVTVAIGSSTVQASNLYVLGESTNSATFPVFCTNSSAAFYCYTTVGVASMTVVAVEETQSVP